MLEGWGTAGIRIQGSHNHRIGGRVSNLRGAKNHTFIDIANTGEYLTIIGCVGSGTVNDPLDGNVYGIVTQGGNNQYIGCNMVNGGTGLLHEKPPSGPDNSGKSLCQGGMYNHNAVYNFNVDGATSGLDFETLHAWGGKTRINDDGIKFYNSSLQSNVMEFEPGISDGESIVFDGVRFQGGLNAAGLLTQAEKDKIIFVNCLDENNNPISI